MIHRYQKKGLNFVLDVNSGAVHLLDDISYAVSGLLDENMGDTCPQGIIDALPDYTADEIREAYDELYELKKAGQLFAQDDYIDVSRYIPVNAPVKALCLHVAHDCNLRCKYCFASTGDFGQGRKIMPPEIAKKAIDFVIARSGVRHNIEVDFFGGEPLMAWDTVTQTVDYARSLEEKYNKKFRFTITTNGLLLDEDKRKYINENMDNCVLSLDGRREVNDEFRKTVAGTGSYDTIVPKFKALVDEKAAAYAKKYDVDYNISFSEQKPSTDTVAADMENKPFRDNGKFLFRPGGHRALIENLNDLDADVIFIKNIDNVVPDKLKGDTVLYKKLIAGVLITLQQQAFAYLQLLDSGKYTHEQVLDILQFVQKKLFCKNPETKNLEDAELVIYLKNKLNRPMRVCGMVKNVGEPGGGPFLAYNSDGTISLQILESSQIDMNDPEKKDMFEKGTHFNPVDLVCAVRDYKGHKFDLVKYVDKATGFISYKSKNGKDLKALELPGLWNGAMSDWNTVFVEVPLTTFNPVKTVNDLLREQHQ